MIKKFIEAGSVGTETVNPLGKGVKLMTFKKNSSKNYVYWDDPNELVSRLRLLTAESQAGNNSVQNEIFEIIEELEESGYIY